jgi:hypothetical protein
MLIVNVQVRKRRDFLKDNECKLIEINKYRVDVEHLRSSTQTCTTNEVGELDHLTPKLLRNTWSF